MEEKMKTMKLKLIQKQKSFYLLKVITVENSGKCCVQKSVTKSLVSISKTFLFYNNFHLKLSNKLQTE